MKQGAIIETACEARERSPDPGADVRSAGNPRLRVELLCGAAGEPELLSRSLTRSNPAGRATKVLCQPLRSLTECSGRTLCLVAEGALATAGPPVPVAEDAHG